MAFQGLAERDWPTIYQNPLFKKAIQSGNRVLKRHNVQVEGRPLNLVEACKKGRIQLDEHSQSCWQQPCIYLLNMLLWDQWRSQYPEKEPILFGLSFGEWSAAAAAECVDRETGLLIATQRGILTSTAGGSSLVVTARQGVSLPIKWFRYRCKRIGGVWVSNINSSQQVIISGDTLAVEEMETFLSLNYPALRTSHLRLGGPFHTPRMQRAKKELRRWFKKHEVRFQEPTLPLILNATGEITRDPEKIQEKLFRQIAARLHFKPRAEEIADDAVIYELCIEAGRPIIGPLIKQVHRAKHQAALSRLTALAFSG